MKKNYTVNFRYYDIIKKPIITEKAHSLGVNSVYCFDVSLDADKPEIKNAIENIFSVKVKDVNTLVRKGKRKTFRGRIGKQSDTKRAFVTLQQGSVIDLGNFGG